jgi:DNA-binding NtrC family response regulator
MEKVLVVVDNPVDRLTLRAILEAEGFVVDDRAGDVAITDSAQRAIELARALPTIVLCHINDAGDAIAAMRQGVHDYILRPFVPGEAALKVRRAAAAGPVSAMPPPTILVDASKMPSLDTVEREHIERVLRACRHNHTRAARVLGIGRNTLWRKLKRYGLEDSGS